MEFATIPFREITKRLFESKHDFECFRKLAIDHYSPQDERICVKKYEKSRKQEREELFKELAKECLRKDNKYEGFGNYEEVILDSICNSKIPHRAFNDIFGHVEKEKELYKVVKRLLKRDDDLRGFKVKDTSSKGRSRTGIRYADFTLLKKPFGRGYEINSVDVKVNPQAFFTFLDQAHDFSLFSKYTFLVSTAGLVLDLARTWKQRPLQAEGVFKDKCKTQGVGIKIIDAYVKVLRDLTAGRESKNIEDELKKRALQELEI